MDLEDKIAKIIKDEYSPTGFEDEGRSTAAAHDIINLITELRDHPTREMLNAALAGLCDDEPDLPWGHDIGDDGAKAIFRVMLNAALKDT